MGDLAFLAAQKPIGDPTRTVNASAFTEPMFTYGKQIEEQKKLKEEKRKNAGARMERAINSMTKASNIDKVPAPYKNSVNQFLMAQKNKYYDAAKLLSQSEVGSDNYITAVEQMNNINQSFTNLDKQLQLLSSRKLEAINDFDKGLVSKGNSPDDVDWLSKMYTDGLPMQIGEGGSLYFEKNGSYVPLDEAPDYFVKDSKAAKSIIDLNSRIYNAGIEDNATTRQMVRMNVREIVESGGRETALSLAEDDSIYPGGLGIVDEDLLRNPARSEELSNLVIDNYTDLIIKSGIQGNSDRLSKQTAVSAARSAGRPSSSAKQGSSLKTSWSEEELNALNSKNVPGVREVVQAIESNADAFFKGMKYDGYDITSAKVANNVVTITYLRNKQPITYSFSVNNPEKIASFVDQNFSKILGLNPTSKEATQVKTTMRAWVKKKSRGAAGGYSISTNGLPIKQ
jgi:hypothetical protein